MLQTHPDHLRLFLSGFSSQTRKGLLLCGLTFVLFFWTPKGHAQQSPDPSTLNWIDGVTIGVGINTFHGDVDSDDAAYTFPRALTTAGLNLRVGIDRRFGPSEQRGIALHLGYDRIYGAGPQGARFTNNLITLDVLGEYEIPGGQDGLFRLFAGGGPTLVVHPWYSSLNSVRRGSPPVRQERGTRLVGTLVVGLTIADRVRIGTRVATTDYLDGMRATGRNLPVDLLGFLNVGYRFDLSN